MTETKIRKDHLRLIFERLKDSYRIIGPSIENDVIVLKEIELHDIPAGYKDHQGKGTYRLGNPQPPSPDNPPTPPLVKYPPLPPFTKGGVGGFDREGNIFSFSVGPDSFKRFLTPPSYEIFSFKRSKKGIAVNLPLKEEKPMAFLGMRACDLSALKLYNKVFLEGPVRDPRYGSFKKNSLIIAVNCLSPGDNCFCNSMGTGPEVKDGFDIAVTELRDSFLLEIGSPQGRETLNGLPVEEVSDKDRTEKDSRMKECKKMMKRSVKVSDLPWIIYRNLEHPRWMDVASRCLACGNCTQVCPTCFCNSSYDYLELSGISKKSQEISGNKIRVWDSCFSKNFARVHGGNFRPSRRARYRHWMTHKLAYWIEQFGVSGCVGCGRCITWCPVGIDITEELEAIRK